MGFTPWLTKSQRWSCATWAQMPLRITLRAFWRALGVVGRRRRLSIGLVMVSVFVASALPTAIRGRAPAPDVPVEVPSSAGSIPCPRGGHLRPPDRWRVVQRGPHVWGYLLDAPSVG